MNQNSISPELLEIFQQGLGETLTADQSRAYLSTADLRSFTLTAAAARAMEHLGNTTASGLFFRAGTAGFKLLVRKHGKAAGIDSLEFRMQPQRKRLMDGVRKILALLVSWNAAETSLDCLDDSVRVTLSSRGEDSGSTEAFICHHFIAGLFQEFLYWAGAGKQYPFQVKPGEETGRLVICFQLQPTD